ncbi:hypothetical protein [Acidocella aminolytica]|nr:hypothetical protein [Acidocella aminolytica]
MKAFSLPRHPSIVFRVARHYAVQSEPAVFGISLDGGIMTCARVADVLPVELPLDGMPHNEVAQ